MILKSAPEHEARAETVHLSTLVVRLLCSKKLQTEATAAWGLPPLATGKVTTEKLNTLFGWWAKRIDRAHGGIATGFGEATGLTKHFPEDAPDTSDVFTIPIPEGVVDLDAPALEKKATDDALAARFPFRVGDVAKIGKRSSVSMPLDDNPSFMKDLRVGTLVSLVDFNNDEERPKFKVKASVMHHGAPADICDWVNAKHLVGAADKPLEADAPGLVPDEIVKGHADDHDVSLVTDWESLLEEKGQCALFNFLKARTMVSMEFALGKMPTYTSKSLSVIHRANRVGAKRTEVWTLCDFAPGELMFAPYTAEVKERLYTQNLAVHVDIPVSAPGNPNRVVALDGRGKSHLSHANAESHTPLATGCLFWAIGRTSDAKCANMSLATCGVTIPEVHVHVPGMPKKTVKLGQKAWPQVYILTNKKAIPKLTKLLALDDKVVARAREDDEKARKAEKDATGKAAARAKEDDEKKRKAEKDATGKPLAKKAK